MDIALPELLRLSCLTDSSSRGNSLASNLRLWFYLNDRSAEFDSGLAKFQVDHSIPYYRRKIVWITNDQLWVMAVRMRPGIRNAGLDERLALVQRIWSFQTSGEPMRAARLGLAALVQAKLLSDEELLTVGQTLSGIDSADGEIWRQLGHRQIAASRWLDAAKSFRRSVACSPTLAARSNRQVEQAWALVRAGEIDTAEELMSRINATRLTVASQDQFARLRIQLKR